MTDETKVDKLKEYYEEKIKENEKVGGHSEEITRRDWLAGLAMQGLIPNADWVKSDLNGVARDAYRLADALIAEGRKENDGYI